MEDEIGYKNPEANANDTRQPVNSKPETQHVTMATNVRSGTRVPLNYVVKFSDLLCVTVLDLRQKPRGVIRYTGPFPQQHLLLLLLLLRLLLLLLPL